MLPKPLNGVSLRVSVILIKRTKTEKNVKIFNYNRQNSPSIYDNSEPDLRPSKCSWPLIRRLLVKKKICYLVSTYFIYMIITYRYLYTKHWALAFYVGIVSCAGFKSINKTNVLLYQ